MLTNEQIRILEKTAELNSGRCDKCHQVIKIYRYRINRNHGLFLRAMADEVRNKKINTVDISVLGLAYSIRSQVTKMRQHGLIARVKNDQGAQIARHWLITKKGYSFLNGNPIAEKVVVYNNQVLGHEGELITIHQLMGEVFDPTKPLYEETSVSQPEARTYDDLRVPQKHMTITAQYQGSTSGFLKNKAIYELKIMKLIVGQPVIISAVYELSVNIVYEDIAAFQRYWKVMSNA